MIATGGGNQRYRHGPQTTTRPGDLLPHGQLVRGANIVPAAPPSLNGGDWWNLWSNWDWTGWIKPQIDWAASLGVNTIRLMGTYYGIYGSKLTRGDYNTRWQQILDYTFGLGLFFYPCGGGDRTGRALTVPDATVISECALTAAIIDKYPHIIGYDMVQEDLTFASTGTNAGDCAGAVRAVSSLPVTFSVDGTNTDSQLLSGIDVIPDGGWSDFCDLHLYSEPTTAQVQSNYFGKGHVKPLLFGEFGAAQDLTTAARQTRYNNTKALLSATYTGTIPRLAGALAWAITDQSTTAGGQWGLFNASGVERHDMGDIFVTFPTT